MARMENLRYLARVSGFTTGEAKTSCMLLPKVICSVVVNQHMKIFTYFGNGFLFVGSTVEDRNA